MTPARILISVAVLLLATPGRAQWSASEEARLAPPAPLAGDDIGRAVAVSGSWALVGAPLDDAAGQTAGAVHVFRRDPLGWSFQTKLAALGTAPGDQFGVSLAAAGDLLVVGAPYSDLSGADSGAAYVFRHLASGWTQVAELRPADGAPGDRFGLGVGTDGTTILVGAPQVSEQGFTEVGAVYVFGLQGGTWTEQARLVPNHPEDKMDFGTAVDVDGDHLVIAARFAVRCYVFERVSGLWSQVAQLTAPTEAHAGGIGRNCAISQGTLVFGAPSDDLSGPGLTDAGSAYVFVRGSNGNWGQQQKLKAALPSDDDQFGRSVGLEGDLIVIGANGVDTLAGPDTGAAFLFRRSGVTWSQETLLVASDAASADEFGRSACLSDGLVILGAPEAAGSGAAYVYGVAPPPAESYCTAGTSASGCTAVLAASGIPSASATSGFSVSAAGLEGAKDGIFFHGTNGRQANPWGNGTSFQCVVPPVKRSALQSTLGSNAACDGFLTRDFNATWCSTCPQPKHNPGAGNLVQVQLWYRDPQNTSNQTTSLSNAVEAGVAP